MEQLLEQVQDKAGISAEQARKAIDAVVEFMQDKLPGPIGDQVAKLVSSGDDGDDGGMVDKLGGMLGG